MSLFLSYAREDRAAAGRVRDELAGYCEVFLDATSIPGGAEWEQAIEYAIRNCKVFVPLVSTASSQSTWVARESLFALNVGVPIVPLLLSGAPPLRFIDRQFIDFRGGFDAGVADLVAALTVYFGPFRRSQEAVDRLIAKAVRALISGDIRAANALVEQFVGPESDLASTGYSLWRKLQAALTTNLAESVGPRLSLLETTRQLPEHYPDRMGYEWTLEIKGASDELDTIASVIYTLHPTFHSPPQKIRSRETGFRLTRIGWGTFTVWIQIEFVDHTAIECQYTLKFAAKHEALIVPS